MTGNHSKGKAKEREFLAYRGVEGFVFPMGHHASGDKDAFGIADGLNLYPSGRVCFFQICHHSTVKRHREAIECFVRGHPLRHYDIELWSWKNEVPGFRLIGAW